MSKRQQFWLWFALYFQLFIIVNFLTLLVLPERVGTRESLLASLGTIHDLAAKAKATGYPLSKEDLEKKIQGLQASRRLAGQFQVIGSDSHWTVVGSVPRTPQTKLEKLTNSNPDWPVYVFSSDSDKFIEIGSDGQAWSGDFQWYKSGQK